MSGRTVAMGREDDAKRQSTSHSNFCRSCAPRAQTRRTHPNLPEPSTARCALSTGYMAHTRRHRNRNNMQTVYLVPSRSFRTNRTAVTQHSTRHLPLLRTRANLIHRLSLVSCFSYASVDQTVPSYIL